MTAATRLMHRWSGWPGAWCLDCGIVDPSEECLAHDGLDYYCARCLQAWPQDECPNGGEHDVVQILCPAHIATVCQYPGMNLFNPYEFEEENAEPI